MFEFKMSYTEPGYHKPGEPPFSFPPAGTPSSIKSNLIEIEGRNGTGKTTLLNCIALALGYLEQEKDLLEKKPLLKQKLEDLDKNESLEYYFKISSDINENIDLIIERNKKEKRKFILNNERVGIDTIGKKFEVLFLTEDDPKKVVTASLGKLTNYFCDLQKRLDELQKAINKNLMDIRDYHKFKEKEKILNEKIDEYNEKINEIEKKIKNIEDRIEKIKRKNDIEYKISLLRHEEEIEDEYENLNKMYEKISNVNINDIYIKLNKIRGNINNKLDALKRNAMDIENICKSLNLYSVNINYERLINNDFTELNELRRKIESMHKNDIIKRNIVDDLINIFGKYDGEIEVPLINKKIKDVKKDLFNIKRELYEDRVISLVRSLDQKIAERKDLNCEIDKLNDKKCENERQIEALENGYDIDIKEKFDTVSRKFADLLELKKQNVDLSNLLNELSKLLDFEGNVATLEKEKVDANHEKNLYESKRSGLQTNLDYLRENAVKNPKFLEKEDALEVLYNDLVHLRERIVKWIRILNDPKASREFYEHLKDRDIFSIKDYEAFINAVGNYLANQFEPVPFDTKLHEVKFFDIEKDAFITKDDRQIPIDKLSKGQSKITALIGTLKKMDPSSKKIVLIDEITDLDPINLNYVKAQLIEEYKKGTVILAVLVRPNPDPSKMLEIRGLELCSQTQN